MKNNEIRKVVQDRDEAIIEWFEHGNMALMDAYVNEYSSEDVTKMWNESTDAMKELTLCNMAMHITTPNVAKHKAKAKARYLEIHELLHAQDGKA